MAQFADFRSSPQVDPEWKELHAFWLAFRATYHTTMDQFLVMFGERPSPSFYQYLTPSGATKKVSTKEGTIGARLRTVIRTAKNLTEAAREEKKNLSPVPSQTQLISDLSTFNNLLLSAQGVTQLEASESGALEAVVVEESPLSEKSKEDQIRSIIELANTLSIAPLNLPAEPTVTIHRSSYLVGSSKSSTIASPSSLHCVSGNTRAWKGWKGNHPGWGSCTAILMNGCCFGLTAKHVLVGAPHDDKPPYPQGTPLTVHANHNKDESSGTFRRIPTTYGSIAGECYADRHIHDLDVATFLFDSNIPLSTNYIDELGSITFPIPGPNQDVDERVLQLLGRTSLASLVGRPVVKLGASTGFTCGDIMACTSDRIVVTPAFVGNFASHGDSGSLLVDQETHLILGVISQVFQPLKDTNSVIVIPVWAFGVWLIEI